MISAHSNDALGFEQYLAEHGDALLRHATIVAADPDVGQDVVQAVPERAYRRWDRIGALDQPHAYLRRMVVNEFISLRRRLSRLQLTERPPEPAARTDHAEQQSDRIALIAGLRRLPPRQRAAVALRYWDGLPDAQIAELLGCAEVSVRGYILRALRTLRLEFDEPVAQLTSTRMESR